jgi:hypothetical protein
MADHKISQVVLAERCGIAPEHINAYIRARTKPTMWSMLLIDEALDELTHD